MVAFAGLCLLATVTNLVPVSAALALGIWLVPLLLLRRRRVPPLFLALAAVLGYFLIWTLLYHPASLGDYAFYRRDGNVFITFAPLLLLALLRLDLDLERIGRGFVYVASGLNAIFLLVFLVTGGTIVFHQPGIYHFLFFAHNAAGGFLAMLTALSLGYYYATRERIFLLLTIANTVGLVATDSRGSMLGLVGAVFIVLVLRGRFTRTLIAAIVVGHLIVIPWFYQNAPASALSVQQPVMIDSDVFAALPRSHTIALRAFYLWPRAWHLFKTSPLVGTGFGSYNDLPYDLRGSLPGVQVNHPVLVTHSDAHAHHTFLHVLAETGLLGLALLVLLLVQAHRAIRRVGNAGLRAGLSMMLWIAILSSLTEHRLFTPSQMLPFTILLGLVVARRAYELRRDREIAAGAAARPRPAIATPQIAGSA